MKIGIITQARMSSKRLPGKVLKKIGGKTLLEYHVGRALNSGFPVIVATSTDKGDDQIETICKEKKWHCFRGDLSDVLSRYYHAAKKYELDVIIRITSDCPLIDSTLIKRGVTLFRKTHVQYISNTVKRTYPAGFDFELFTFTALESAYMQATKKYEREHVTPYIWQHPNLFSIKQLTQKHDYSQYRLTVDEIDDFSLVRKLIEEFGVVDQNYRTITKIMRENSELADINKEVRQKNLQE